MVTSARLKNWGSSLGIVIPKRIIKEKNLRAGEEILIDIKKKKTIKEVFGSLKNWKIDAQKMKDELRKEWSR